MEKPLPSPAPSFGEGSESEETLDELTSSAQFAKSDFMIVSEFSEQEGPRPLLIIPAQGGCNFPINEFVVRIMAVDHQKQEGSLFAEDSQQVVPEEGFYCYVHHLTLLDIAARGYVRPICISYITADPQKLMFSFKKMMDECQKISNMLKYGNQWLFLLDLEERLKSISTNTSSHASSVSSMSTPTTSGHAAMVSVGHSTPTIPSSGNAHAANNATSPTEKGNVLLLKKIHESIHQAKAILRPGFSGKNPAIGRLMSLLSGGGDANEQSIAQAEIITFLHKARSFENTLRPIMSICGQEYNRVLSRLENIHLFFSRPLPVIMLEQEEQTILRPEKTLLCIGKTIQSNLDQNHARIDKKSSPSHHINTNTGSMRSFRDIYSNNSSVADIAADSSPHSSSDSFESMYSAHDDDLTESTNVPKDRNVYYDYQRDQLKPLNIPVHGLEEGMDMESFAAALWNSSGPTIKLKPGQGLLHLRQRYSFLRHIVFSILKGRPVIILGHPRNEDKVREAVNGLSIFVATLSQTGVCHWRTTPLRMSDLSDLKLIGMSKSACTTVPLFMEKNVTLWDFEAETINGPSSQKCAIIEAMLNSKKSWPNEETFLAFVQVNLLELAIKVALYYQMCVINITVKSNEGIISMIPNEEFCLSFTKRSGAKQAYIRRFKSMEADIVDPSSHFFIPPQFRETSRNIFVQLTNMSALDLTIIEYLAEVVKIRQYYELIPQCSPVMKLDYSPTIKIKNTVQRPRRQSVM